MKFLCFSHTKSKQGEPTQAATSANLCVDGKQTRPLGSMEWTDGHTYSTDGALPMHVDSEQCGN
jgi:hypothetical protein